MVGYVHLDIELAKSGAECGDDVLLGGSRIQRHRVWHLVERLQFYYGRSLPGRAVAIGPGSAAFPGQPVTVTQPTFQWQAVAGADQYALYVRQMNADGSQGAIVFNSQTAGVTISGSSTMYVPPSGFLQDGGYYCWNMNSHSGAGWSTAYSTPLYFSVAVTTASGQYNAAAAVAYAEKYAYTVCSDGYFWMGEAGDPAYKGAGQLVPTGAGVDGGVGDDCATSCPPVSGTMGAGG